MPILELAELKIEDYKSEVEPDWCPGCGDFGVLQSLQKAAFGLKIRPDDLMVVSGIGCSSNLPGFIHAYGVHSLHGRSIPVATGIKLANPALKVCVTGGDGDGWGIGVGHAIHAMRRNADLTYLVMDNQVYGLTTGQTSPTTTLGIQTKSTPAGNPEQPLNPITLAIAAGASFVARGFSGEPAHLVSLMQQAIQHRGFALIDIFSPCVTYNKLNTYPWFRQRVYKLEESGHNPSDYGLALAASTELGEKIPIGVFYKHERPLYDDLDPVLKKHNPMQLPLGISKELGAKLLAEFA